jgi:hypothetical protein
VNLTATVSVDLPGAGVPDDGTVTFMEGSTNLGTANVANGTAQLSLGLMTGGAQPLTVDSQDMTFTLAHVYQSAGTDPVAIALADDQGGTATATFNVAVTGAGFSSISLSNSTVADDQLAGTVVGCLSTLDPNAGVTFAYSLVPGVGSGDNGSFTIAGNQLETNAVLDYATQSTYNVRILSMDSNGLSFEDTFAITVGAPITAPPSMPTSLSATSVSTNEIDLTWTDDGTATSYTLQRGTLDPNAAAEYQFNIADDGTTSGQTVLTITQQNGEVAAGGYLVLDFTMPDGSTWQTGPIDAALDNVDACFTTAAPTTSPFTGESSTSSGGATTITLTGSIADASMDDSQVDYGIDWTALPTTSGPALCDTNVSPETGYYYRVCASNPLGTSDYSPMIQAAAVPDTPTNFSVTAISGIEVSVSWQDPSGGREGFDVEQLVDGQWQWLDSVPAGTTTDTITGQDFAPSTTYSFCVMGSYPNSTTDSQPSNVVATQLPSGAILASTITANSSESAPNYGDNVTLSVTVGPADGSGVTPTGSVDFYDTSTSTDLGSCALDCNGDASISTSDLDGGDNQITVTYSGDTNYGGSNTSIDQEVAMDDTTTTLASDGTPAAYGQTVTFTATVAGQYGGTPTGSVDFFDETTNQDLGSYPLGDNGTATVSTSSLVAGEHWIEASYAGDANFVGSSATTDQQAQMATTTTVSSLLSGTSVSGTSAYGQSVTFTAAVSVVGPGSGTPSGSVDFYDQSTDTDLGTYLLGSDGEAGFTTPYLGLGNHEISVTFLGDPSFASSSTSIDQPVQTATSAVTLASSAPSGACTTQEVTFTAWVSGQCGGTPTGSVDFYDYDTTTQQGQDLGSAALDLGGEASIAASGLAVGDHEITATYYGDGSFDGVSSAPLKQNVRAILVTSQTSQDAATQAPQPALSTQGKTGAALVSGDNPDTGLDTGVVGWGPSSDLFPWQSATLTACVTTCSGGAIPITGTVDFYDGTTDYGSVEVQQYAWETAGASITVPQLKDILVDGNGDEYDEITVSYSGDVNYAPSSSTFPVSILQAATLTTATPATSSTAYGQTATFTATVTPYGITGPTPTGTVDFVDQSDEQDLGTYALSGGSATISTSDLSAGWHAISADYSGDNNYLASSTYMFAIDTVQPAPSTTTVSAEDGLPTVGQPATLAAMGAPADGSGEDESIEGQFVTFTATVSGIGPKPTGSVEFYDNFDGQNNDMGSATVDSNDEARLCVSDLSVGDNQVTAVYYGDLNHSGSTGGPVDQQVDQPIIITASTMANGSPSGTLPHSQNNDEGAYVPLDDGDADGNGTPADMVSDSADDTFQLLPITLNQMSAGGDYILHVPDNVQVWLSDTKKTTVPDGATFDASTDTRLFVEGTVAGVGTITVDWVSGIADTDTLIENADSLTVNVFTMEGPQDVPDDSTYNYVASGGYTTSDFVGWGEPTGGTVVQSDPGSSQQQIKWGAGPNVGTIEYQASDYYGWSRNVYIVNVAISGPEGAPTFTPGTPYDGGTIGTINSGLCKRIWSGTNTNPGMQWSAAITLTGPDGNKGVTNIKVGFVQDVYVAADAAVYKSGDILTDDMQGNEYLDADPNASPATLPYYDSNTVADQFVIGGPWRAQAVFVPTSPSDTTATIGGDDTPYGGPPVVNPGDASDPLVSMSLKFVYTTYVVAQTLNTQNGAGGVYTALADANWVFRADAAITNSPPN